MTNTLKAFKCGIGEGWRRSVKDALKNDRQYEIELRKKGISCMYI